MVSPRPYAPVSPRPRTGWVWHLLAGVVLASMFISLIGCTTTIIPPQQVQQPVPVLLLDHGYTASLVLPRDLQQTQVARYAFGDYRYYAQGRRGSGNAMRALFWPTTGTLGRRIMPGPIQVEHVLDIVAVDSEHVHVIEVDWWRVEKLLAELDAVMQARQADALVNLGADLVFVADSRSYTLCHNSNHAVARWLEALGCQLRGPAMVSRWQVLDRSSDG